MKHHLSSRMMASISIERKALQIASSSRVGGNRFGKSVTTAISSLSLTNCGVTSGTDLDRDRVLRTSRWATNMSRSGCTSNSVQPVAIGN
jgi:hypothetical protein